MILSDFRTICLTEFIDKRFNVKILWIEFELNWTYFIAYTNTNGLDASSDNLVNPLQNNKLYGCTTGNDKSMCIKFS